MASASAGKRLTTSARSKQIQCPRCLQLDTRVVEGNRSVCCCCSLTLRRVYQFCWACRREWPKTAQGHTCSLLNCGLRAALLSEEKIVDPKSSAFQCPFFRACPGCKALLTHNGVGCRYITCPECRREFCFRCLCEECDLGYDDYLYDDEDEDEPIKTCVIVDNHEVLQSL